MCQVGSFCCLQVSGVVGRADVLACLLFLMALMTYVGSTARSQGWRVRLAKVGRGE